MLKNVTSVVEKDDTINMFKILIFLILCHFSVNIPPIGPRLMYRGRTCVSLARTHRQISFFHFFPPGKQFQGSLHCHFYQVKKSVLELCCMILTFPSAANILPPVSSPDPTLGNWFATFCRQFIKKFANDSSVRCSQLFATHFATIFGKI